jgi:hypothetical protein
MKKTKTFTHIPERFKRDHIYAYGHALHALSLQSMCREKMLLLKDAFNVGTSLPDEFVHAGILKKEKKDGKLFLTANHSTPPTKDECWACYKNQTQRVNNSKSKPEYGPELFDEEPLAKPELSVESLAQQVFKLTEIMNKFLTQTPTK